MNNGTKVRIKSTGEYGEIHTVINQTAVVNMKNGGLKKIPVDDLEELDSRDVVSRREFRECVNIFFEDLNKSYLEIDGTEVYPPEARALLDVAFSKLEQIIYGDE